MNSEIYPDFIIVATNNTISETRDAKEINAMLQELLNQYTMPKMDSNSHKTVELWGHIQALRWVLKLRDDLKPI